jgi:hypothetical protein
VLSGVKMMRLATIGVIRVFEGEGRMLMRKRCQSEIKYNKNAMRFTMFPGDGSSNLV